MKRFTHAPHASAPMPTTQESPNAKRLITEVLIVVAGFLSLAALVAFIGSSLPGVAA